MIATCYDGSPIADTELSLFDFEPKENKTTRQAHKIIITEVTDKNSDGAFDLSDIKILLANKKNALTRLKGNGDFRSIECIELLKQADIVCTNPPFSLFREYIAQLVEYGKKFIVIGNKNAITYKEIFPLIKENKLWMGFTTPGDFIQITQELPKKMTGLTRWFTNLEHKKRYEKMILYRNYSPEAYPKYDNYDAIEVSKVSDIPCDYDGVMGVPITFLDKYNPDQFEIVCFRKGEDGKDLIFTREREREFNHTFVSLYDGNSGNDKECRRKNKWENYLRQNHNSQKTEPIDFFYPITTNLANGLVNNCTVNHQKTYVRILIRKKK